MFRPKPIPPGPGQESVWDFPRPAIAEPTGKRIEIVFNGVLIADTTNAYRVLETSHPPSYYLPTADIKMEFFHPAGGGSFCEWKGAAKYYSIEVDGKRAEKAAWYYSNPSKTFLGIKDHVAFYLSMMDEGRVDGEVATPQAGGFYGGWITSDVVGPFKGEPGTRGW